MPNPWDTIEERHNIGDLIAGRVTNIEDFGAFVEVQKGVVGLVHVSEIDIYGPATIHDIIRPGDEVLVRIIDIDPYEERLSLSLRRVSSEEQIAWMQRHDDEDVEDEAAEGEETEEVEAVADEVAEETEEVEIEDTPLTEEAADSDAVAEVETDLSEETATSEAVEEAQEPAEDEDETPLATEEEESVTADEPTA
jgi:ribosomal protein S1